MTGHGLPAAWCPEGGVTMVGSPTQNSWAVSSGLPTLSWFPWHIGFPGYQTGGNLGTGLSSAMLGREVGDASQSSCNAAWDLQRCMAPLMHLEGDEIMETSLLRPMDNGPWTPAEEAVLLGDEPEPQLATAHPCEHMEETPKDAVKQSDTPCPPVPSAVVSSASSNQSHATRRAWHRAWPRHQATPDPLNNPNDWVLAYLAERDELPNCWWEFRSLHCRDAGPLSDAQVQELPQKQAVSLRLPTAWREESGWWNTLPSLAGLGYQDFLPPSPFRPWGHLSGKKRSDGGTGEGPAMVCWPVGGSPQHTL